MALPGLIDVLLRVGVLGWSQPFYVPSPDYPEQHDRVEQLEQRFREGVGQHDHVDICQQELLVVLDVLLVDDVDDATGVQDVEYGVVQDERALVLGVGVVSFGIGKCLDLW